MEAYLRLAELCEREAGSARDPRERRQFSILSRAIRSWAEEEHIHAPSARPSAPSEAEAR
ncbi:hypothetical protein DJ019_03020 [Phenylobacterium kunshanense]|uniref:Uncharacterized protein n=2 Tax=Phenylobacterium kunshanense TaxID=1445034 RepID=A0A328BQM8_9CAUL|nr:hypothetical protein DJ019_03020 [Phenylobacterium kunshanense]